MATNSKIEWTDHTWNPWRGCTRVSPACDNCYMMRDAKRYGLDGTVVQRCADKTFRAPLSKKWKAGDKVFVCSWSDFFHPDADLWRAEAWDIIRQRPDLVFQILTKRPERIAKCLPSDWGSAWPNVWLGVTAENQKQADRRIPILLEIPATKRFVSIEPMLGPIDLQEWSDLPQDDDAPLPGAWGEFAWPDWVPSSIREELERFWCADWGRGPREWRRTKHNNRIKIAMGAVVGVDNTKSCPSIKPVDHPRVTHTGRLVDMWNNIGRIVYDDGGVGCCAISSRGYLSRWLQSDGMYRTNLHWVICGGETGPGARHMEIDWARSVRNQCRSASVPFFFKQMAGKKPIPDDLMVREILA